MGGVKATGCLILAPLVEMVPLSVHLDLPDVSLRGPSRLTRNVGVRVQGTLPAVGGPGGPNRGQLGEMTHERKVLLFTLFMGFCSVNKNRILNGFLSCCSFDPGGKKRGYEQERDSGAFAVLAHSSI